MIADDTLVALSMSVGRGRPARWVAAAAELTREDRVVDIGCGPGAAARMAAQAAGEVIGVDPSPVALGLARWISTVRRVHGATWMEGVAESLPLDDGRVTVAWALSSVHHWTDRRAGLREIHRVVVPGGRVVLAERLIRSGARGHAAHGLSAEGADDLMAEMESAGFSAVGIDRREAGRRPLLVVHGIRDGAT